MKKKPIIVKVRWGGEEMRRENGDIIDTFECTTENDAQNLINAIATMSEYEEYSIADDDGSFED